MNLALADGAQIMSHNTVLRHGLAHLEIAVRNKSHTMSQQAIAQDLKDTTARVLRSSSNITTEVHTRALAHAHTLAHARPYIYIYISIFSLSVPL